VAKQGAAWLSRARRGYVGCGVNKWVLSIGCCKVVPGSNPGPGPDGGK
jgi:hypothetical protein